MRTDAHTNKQRPNLKPILAIWYSLARDLH
jgi:hypothetical protein